ncbi:MAG: insulinase family protein [Paludibacteraceae bacterium]|nr:insulinase family protein [Paludibacteraceae bacterium]MBP5481792.1 insulinase family protein [Paludibacteraceae bacterium]
MKESPISYKKLPNGVRLVHLRDRSPVAYCGFVVNVGTRDELPEESGMAHFVEHLLFKGTRKRRAWHILNRVESVGGELNAYTTKEETFVYATVLTTHFERAMELCADVVFHSTFPQKEMDKEVDVIIDEIQSYKDSPSELIYDDFENMIFSGSPMGRYILGDKKALKHYVSEDVRRFVDRTYSADRILFFSIGNIDFKRIERWAEKYFMDVPVLASNASRSALPLYVPQQKLIRKNTCQSHVMIGTRAFDLNDDRRLAFGLVNNILGGTGMNSRLNLLLRERNGMAYNVESVFTPYSDTGIFSVYFGTDEKNREKCTALVMEELKRMRTELIPPRKLLQLKRQWLGQLAIAQENRENLVLSLARSFLYFDKFESLELVKSQLEKISSEMLIDVSETLLREDLLSVLVYSDKV